MMVETKEDIVSEEDEATAELVGIFDQFAVRDEDGQLWVKVDEAAELVVGNEWRQAGVRAAKYEAWSEGYRTCDRLWAETADLVTPDEDRTDPRNPYRASVENGENN